MTQGWSMIQRDVGSEEALTPQEFDTVEQRLQQWSKGTNRHKHQKDIYHFASRQEPRPIQPVTNFHPKLSPPRNNNNKNNRQQKIWSKISIQELQNFIPAQALLTCYYSVNHQTIMSDYPLLSKHNMDRI